MRVVPDTNVVVSAFLFGGHPRELLTLLCRPPFEIWTSRALLRELATVLSHGKLAPALTSIGLGVEALVQAYASQTSVIRETALQHIEFRPDPGDEVVIAAARAANADWLVTGDRHLLDARQEISCAVLTVAEALERARALVAAPRPPGDT